VAKFDFSSSRNSTLLAPGKIKASADLILNVAGKPLPTSDPFVCRKGYSIVIDVYTKLYIYIYIYVCTGNYVALLVL